MPTPPSFDYAVLRLVPRVERAEFVNVGVVLYCLERDFLAARYLLVPARLLALAPALDLGEVQAHLEAVVRICEGGPAAGPLGALSLKERFHWIVAPRSTILQTSPVHTGLCAEPADALAELLQKMVA